MQRHKSFDDKKNRTLVRNEVRFFFCNSSHYGVVCTE